MATSNKGVHVQRKDNNNNKTSGCETGFMKLVVESISPLLEDFRLKSKSFVLRVTLNKKKQQVKQVSSEKLNNLNTVIFFPCFGDQVLKFQLLISQSQLTPHAYAEFPIAKLYQIEKVRHCVAVELADFKKFKGNQISEVFGIMNLEISIFNENIGTMRFKSIVAAVPKDAEKYRDRDVRLIMETKEEIYQLPVHEANGGNPSWHDVSVKLFSIQTQITFKIATVGAFGEKLIGEEKLAIDHKEFLENPGKVVPVELPILKSEQRVFTLKLACQFQYLEGDYF